MLPITNKRAIHIPHSIATAAAVVALIVALGTTLGGTVRTDEATGLIPADDTLDHAASVSSQEPASSGEAPVRAGGAKSESSALSGLLPLVLPSISGY